MDRKTGRNAADDDPPGFVMNPKRYIIEFCGAKLGSVRVALLRSVLP